MKFTSTTYLIIFLLLIFSCEKQNLNNANKSLKGKWQVVQIFSNWGIKNENGNIIPLNTIDETGELGTFNFDEENVEYNFTRADTIYNNNTTWLIDRTKENAGFTQVEVYTLTFDDLNFRCRFGDETSDAEKNATEIQLYFETNEVGKYNSYLINLNKVE